MEWRAGNPTTAAILTAGLMLLAPGRAAGEAFPLSLRVMLGANLVAGGSDLVPPGLAGEEDVAGFDGSIDFFLSHGGRITYGLGLELLSNTADVGEQRFSISTVRPTLQVHLTPWASDVWAGARTKPFLRLAGGWNFHSTDVSRAYSPGQAPAGTGDELDLSDSFGLCVSAGVQSRVSSRVHLIGEAGWHLNNGDFRMVVAGYPDQSGDFDLSGVSIRAGVHIFESPAE